MKNMLKPRKNGLKNQDQVKKILGVPEGVRVVNLLTLGYPEKLGPKTGRKPLSEIVFYDKYTL